MLTKAVKMNFKFPPAFNKIMLKNTVIFVNLQFGFLKDSKSGHSV